LRNPVQQRSNKDMDRATTYDQEDWEYIWRDSEMKSKLQNAWYTSPSNSQADWRDGQVDRWRAEIVLNGSQNASISGKVFETWYCKHHGELVADKGYIEHDNHNSYDRKGVRVILTCSNDITDSQMTKRGETLSRVRYYLLLDQYILNAQCGNTLVI
jgi:hypothetical protein